MKKISAIVLSILILIPLFSFPASANADLGYIPLNIYSNISTASNGTKDLALAFYNKSGKTISSFNFTVYPRDIYGNTLRLSSCGQTSIDYTVNQSVYSGGTCRLVANLSSFRSASSKTLVRITRVYFSDGSVWTYNASKNYYTEANFKINNNLSSSWKYLVTPGYWSVSLEECGYGVYARDWYYWDDNEGWIWFSSDMYPSLKLNKVSNSIKLVINNNENLYKMINFSIEEQPVFNILFRNTGHLTNSRTYEDFNAGSWGVPYAFDLWDLSEAKTRDWYIYINGEWIWFSSERGPCCYVWQKEGRHGIKVVHDKNENDSTAYYFDIN